MQNARSEDFWLLFSFQHFNDVISLFSGLQSSAKKSMVNLIFIPFSDSFYVRGQKQCIFLAASKFFSLSLDFSYLIMMCLGEISCAFVMSGARYTSQICDFIVFTELDKILAIIYPHIFLLLPLNTHTSSEIPLHMCQATCYHPIGHRDSVHFFFSLFSFHVSF